MKFFAVLFLSVSLVYAADVVEELKQGNIQFSTQLYKHIAKETSDNVILSPLSVQLVLALSKLGAKGETAAELTKSLHLPESPDKIKEGFKGIISKLKGNQYYSLDTANKIYLNDGYLINPEFLKLAQEIFDASLESVKFAENVKAADTINKWVESRTNKKIQNLVDPSALDKFTRMVLVNALYFQANWSLPFDEYATSKRKFYKSEKEELDVHTMHKTATFKYAENKDLDAKLIQIFYQGGDITFTIALPNKREGLGALEDRLSEVLLPQKYGSRRLSLYMPKFKIESSFNLNSVLQKLGIQKAFDPNGADFSGLLANDERLVITNVVQKAFINVTESGTEAAAATAVTFAVATSFIPEEPPLEIHVDRPFFFAINQGSLPLFVGRVVEPSV
ncbi:hypothetical protein WA026_005573 [Henosepilachna vigintioctopunctata]